MINVYIKVYEGKLVVLSRYISIVIIIRVKWGPTPRPRNGVSGFGSEWTEV